MFLIDDSKIHCIAISIPPPVVQHCIAQQTVGSRRTCCLHLCNGSGCDCLTLHVEFFGCTCSCGPACQDLPNTTSCLHAAAGTRRPHARQTTCCLCRVRQTICATCRLGMHRHEHNDMSSQCTGEDNAWAVRVACSDNRTHHGLLSGLCPVAGGSSIGWLEAPVTSRAKECK